MEELKVESFKTKEDMISWANSYDGSDYIISITFDTIENMWHLFYIK